MNLFDKIMNEQNEISVEHLNHIPIIKDLLTGISKQIVELNPKKADNLPKETQLIIYKIYKGNIELLESIVSNLLTGSFVTVDILSRVLSEYSINILYILAEDVEFRSKSFLNSFLNHQSKKALAWNKSHVDNSNECDMSKMQAECTRSVLEYWGKVFNIQSNHNWPDARSRFRKCNLDEEYLTSYKSASDTIHSFSEDVFNYVTSFISESKEDINFKLNCHENIRKSFSIYLALNSIRLFLFACLEIADLTNEQNEIKSIEKVLRKIEDLVILHNREIPNCEEVYKK
jgi:hypothetical protein